MKITIIIFAMLVKSLSIFAQEGSANNEKIIYFAHVSNDSLKAKTFHEYADSINNFQTGNLPYFIQDPCLDLTVGLWKSFHSPMSIRWEILQKVNNKAALKRVLATKDRSLFLKCSSKSTFQIPYFDKSYKYLIKKRIKEL